MSGPRDNALVLRDGSTALTADETLTFQVNPRAYKEPLVVKVLFPTAPTGTTPTCTVTVKSTDDDKKFEIKHTDAITDTNPASFPFTLTIGVPQSKSNDYSVVLDVDVASGNEAYGNVQVWVERFEHWEAPSTP